MIDDENQTPPEAIPVTEEEQAPPEEKKPRARRSRRKVEPKGDPVERIKEEAKERPEGEERSKLNDPNVLQTVPITEDNDGPKMRLLRSNRFRQMQIQFDDKPQQEVIELLKDEGFRWNQTDRVWTLAMNPTARGASHAIAERLFQDIASTIREANGLGPVGQVMAG